MNKIKRKIFYNDIYRNLALHVDTCVWLNKYNITINSCSLCIFTVAVVLCTYLNNIGTHYSILILFIILYNSNDTFE